MSDLPFLDLHGNDFERGMEHGRVLKQAISENLETYFERFNASGLSADNARQEGKKWAEVIAKKNAAYTKEMEGIAEGSGHVLSDIAMLNARYEITFGLMKEEAAVIDLNDQADGCTTFGVLPQATDNGHTVLGQNWDWLVGVYGRCTLMRVKREQGPDFICYTEAGIVGGKMGVNQHGIGLVENGLVSDHDGHNRYEKPFHVRCREVLDAETFDMALLPILASRRVCSANFMIGHADGEIINLETSPDAVSYHFPNEGLITHSNHFLDKRHGPSQMERLSPSTLYRANRLDNLLRKDIGKLDIKNFQAAFADHFGTPNSICRHPDLNQPEAKRTMTNASFIIDLVTRTMHVADGQPCQNEFISYAL